MDRFSLENRLANLRGKHPFLTNSESLRELRQAEKAALASPEVRSGYQAARNQTFESMLPAFPALSTIGTARPALEDELFHIASASSSEERAKQLKSLQQRLASFSTNGLYVSDWCQLDILLLCSCVEPNVSNALRRSRSVALVQITNGAAPDLIKSAMAASQLELEASDIVGRVQELNRAIGKLAGGKTGRAPSDDAERSFSRMQLATSNVRLEERLVLFPATELLASTGNDALPAIPAYLDRLAARTNTAPVQDKGSLASTGAGEFFRRWGLWGAVGLLIIIGIACAFVKKIVPLLQPRPQPIEKQKVFANVLGEDVPADEADAPSPGAPAPVAKTAKECFAQGFIGSGMEMLEQVVKADPKNFDRRVELARAYHHYCHNPKRAVQIIRELLESPHFTPDQEAQAREILKEWE